MVVESKKNLFDALRAHNATGFVSGLSTMTTRFFERIGADLKASWWQILLGLLLTIVLGLLWIYIMRFIAAYMVWASIVLSLVLLWGGNAQYFVGPISWWISDDQMMNKVQKGAGIAQCSSSWLSYLVFPVPSTC
uniref:Uncharacterized protein n=1 Tax=Romanomermis culicivorax TaxID=13658 RepID=A0A915I8S7_ROMCU